jgi:hypothetical protein
MQHKTLAMTMVYARIADKTVANEYFAVTEKVEALYDKPRHLPSADEGSEMRKLRSEMHRRMLGNGYCARPVEMDCHFESICESCTFFVTTLDFRPTLERQRRRRCKEGPGRPSKDLRWAARPTRRAGFMTQIPWGLDAITHISGTTDVSTAPSAASHQQSLRRSTITSARPLTRHDSKPPSLQKTQGNSVVKALLDRAQWYFEDMAAAAGLGHRMLPRDGRH